LIANLQLLTIFNPINPENPVPVIFLLDLSIKPKLGTKTGFTGFNGFTGFYFEESELLAFIGIMTK
jgi:hypothetical protein